MSKRIPTLLAGCLLLLAFTAAPSAEARPAGSADPFEPVWSWLQELWETWTSPAVPTPRERTTKEGASFDPNGHRRPLRAVRGRAGGSFDPDGAPATHPLPGEGAGWDPDGVRMHNTWGRAGASWDPDGAPLTGAGAGWDPDGARLRNTWGRAGASWDPNGSTAPGWIPGEGGSFDPDGIPSGTSKEGVVIDPVGETTSGSEGDAGVGIDPVG